MTPVESFVGMKRKKNCAGWIDFTYTKQRCTYSVFMLRMALRDITASVTAFLNCLQGPNPPKRSNNQNMPIDIIFIKVRM